MKKKLVLILSMLVIGCGAYGVFATASSQQNVAKPAAKSSSSAVSVKANSTVVNAMPLDIVANPQKYLHKNIRMKATFDKFSTLGLDYTPALRKSEDYIGILIRRDDVTDHVLPLSEMKLFLKRKVAEKYIELDSGDKIQIDGYVFSVAMGDPWIDINKLTILSSKKPINTK